MISGILTSSLNYAFIDADKDVYVLVVVSQNVGNHALGCFLFGGVADKEDFHKD